MVVSQLVPHRAGEGGEGLGGKASDVTAAPSPLAEWHVIWGVHCSLSLAQEEPRCIRRASQEEELSEEETRVVE